MTQPGAGVLPYDPMRGQPLPCLIVNEQTALAVMPVQWLLNLVPDPVVSENPKRIDEDPKLREYAALREEVQRLFEGAKKRNAQKYAEYLIEGLDGVRPTITPPITLYHRESLDVVELAPGVSALMLPFDAWMVAIDGETQRIARQRAALARGQMALSEPVAVVIHHGKPVAHAKQGFYDLNTREVKPNAAVAIAMDTLDPATQITRTLSEQSPVLKDRVNLQRRQLRARDPELVTISGLRTGVVTTILGLPGLQTGSRPIDLPEGVDPEALEAEVVDVWSAIVEALEDELQPAKRRDVVVSAPSVLAGLGVVAHHAVSSPPRPSDEDSWSVDEVVRLLEDIRWEKYVDPEDPTSRSPWDGVAGKRTPTGRFSIGGPKEVGYMVARAIEDPTSEAGRQIRSR